MRTFLVAAALVALAPRGAFAGAEAQELANATTGADLRTPIPVTDLGQLTELVRDDPAASRATARLANRRLASVAVAVVGVPTTMYLAFQGWLSLAVASTDVGTSEDEARGRTMALSALAVGTVSALGIWALAPTRTDLSHVVEGWNERHPEHLLELAGRERTVSRGDVIVCLEPGRLDPT